jgi:hypothetical protein
MTEKYVSLADQIETRDGVLESVLGTDENFSLDKENYPRLDDETIYHISPWSIKQWADFLPGLNEEFAKLYKKQPSESSISPQAGFMKNFMKLETLRSAKNAFYSTYLYKESSPQIYNDILSHVLTETKYTYTDKISNEMLTSKYINKVSFGDNPFSECKPLSKRKWYQFWKK